MITKTNPSCAELGPAQPQLVSEYYGSILLVPELLMRLHCFKNIKLIFEHVPIVERSNRRSGHTVLHYCLKKLSHMVHRLGDFWARSMGELLLFFMCIYIWQTEMPLTWTLAYVKHLNINLWLSLRFQSSISPRIIIIYGNWYLPIPLPCLGDEK